MEWLLTTAKLKTYPHFDRSISLKTAQELASNPEYVARHAFFPFLHYEKRWNLWAEKNAKSEPKVRQIRYAARLDSCIFSKYRHQLSEIYEKNLRDHNLNDVVLAYRKILKSKNVGKCNIDYAYDVFKKIRSMDKGIIISIDIKKYFDNMDHGRIKKVWCDLLGVEKLPIDHYKVYRAITKYSHINKNKLYIELGHIGEKIHPITGKNTFGYITNKKNMPRPQICTPKQLREIISNSENVDDIFYVHKHKHGIPQGAPLSDLIANVYLMEFDLIMNKFASDNNGFYCRYSDDILIIINNETISGENTINFVEEKLGLFGSELKISTDKTHLVRFIKNNEKIMIKNHNVDSEKKSDIQYLGFRFDGENIYIKNSTISNLWRKTSKSANIFALKTIKKNPNKTLLDIKSNINVHDFIKKYSRVEDFDKGNIKSWNFYTYVNRAIKIMGKDSLKIQSQMKNHRKVIRQKLESSIDYYHEKFNKK